MNPPKHDSTGQLEVWGVRVEYAITQLERLDLDTEEADELMEEAKSLRREVAVGIHAGHRCEAMEARVTALSERVEALWRENPPTTYSPVEHRNGVGG